MDERGSHEVRVQVRDHNYYSPNGHTPSGMRATGVFGQESDMG